MWPYCGGGGDRRGGDAEYHSNHITGLNEQHVQPDGAVGEQTDWQAFYDVLDRRLDHSGLERRCAGVGQSEE